MSIEPITTNESGKPGEKKRGIYQILVEHLTGIFFPIINLITAASIIKSVLVILSTAGFLSRTDGIYRLFYAVSDGFFFFLPFYLAVAAAKQWKADPGIAMMIPCAMLYPDIVNFVEQNQEMAVFGIPVPHAVYQCGVIPVLLAVGLLCLVEKPCDRYISDKVRGFVKPVVCCLIVIPVTFLLFGPLGARIGDGLTSVFFSLYNRNPVLAGAFMGFVIQPMVVVGAHWSLVPICLGNIAANGYDVIMPLVGGAVYAQSGAALAVALLCKKDKKMKQAALQAAFTAGLGVSEPALYGVNVPLVRPMITACLSGAVGGAMVGMAGTQCMSFVFPSYLTCVAYVGPGFLIFLVSMAVCFVLALVLTLLQGKKIAVR